VTEESSLRINFARNLDLPSFRVTGGEARFIRHFVPQNDREREGCFRAHALEMMK